MPLFGKSIATCVVAVMLCACATVASAQTLFEKLVMPGPLIEGHAKWENECEKCHEAFSRQGQSALCLNCHKDVSSDRSSKKGFHGRDPSAANRDCKHCHTDHKGRAAQIAPLDKETFNHELTNFKLGGVHASARCEGCHAPAVKYRKASGRCIDCHKSNDAHKGRLGEDCQKCHTEQSWREAKLFDHAKTKFPLVGSHKSAPCASCHAGERYRDIGLTCVSCHKPQDKHSGRYGEKCETCHSSTKWTEVRFNHDKSTKFPLRGKHIEVKCDTCHTGSLYRDKLSTACASCHQKNDPHKGQLGTRCGSCHQETGWRKTTAFDHDVTRFPLIGLHAAVACDNCHKTPRFKDAPMACESCHKDTKHEGRLGSACARCHNPNGWSRWRFDHSKSTRFALTGKHQAAHCHSCHATKSVVKIQLDTSCYGCHSADDSHRGAFGRACEQCHDTATFRQRVQRR